MPWTAAQARSHTAKADSPAKQRAWARIANSALRSCQKKGNSDCEGYAIRVANAAISKWEK